MRNLFVCHTQAHLVLACGLSRGRFNNDENYLVLFKDFNLSNEMSQRLSHFFASYLPITGTYPSVNKSLVARLRWYGDDCRLLRRNINTSFNRVFAVCDWTPPVQYCLKRCLRQNKNTQFIWLEDGILSYYPNIECHKGTDRFSFTLLLRKVLFKYIFNYGSIYDRDFEEMGGLKVFRQIYTLYPEAVRNPYKTRRELVRITDDEYSLGVNMLYESRNLNVPAGSLLLIIDKLDTYLYPDRVKNAFLDVITKANNEGRQVFCKFHPREDTEWSVFYGCTILDKAIGAESLFLSLSSMVDSISIIGVKSAGLMSARKMGYHVSSLFLLCGETNDSLLAFFNKIGIIMAKEGN